MPNYTLMISLHRQFSIPLERTLVMINGLVNLVHLKFLWYYDRLYMEDQLNCTSSKEL